MANAADVIVVGLGAMGSAALYQPCDPAFRLSLARAGNKALIGRRSSVPPPKGGSRCYWNLLPSASALG